MEIHWTLIKDAMHNLSQKSGADSSYAKGVLVGIVAFFKAINWSWSSIWEKLIPMIPDDAWMQSIPVHWLSKDTTSWSINWSDVVSFPKLLSGIPSEMLKVKADQGLSTNAEWICRDYLLDRYLYVCAIMQRTSDQAIAEWLERCKQSKTRLAGPSPRLSFVLNEFRKAGSQYIAEWSITDHNKEHRPEAMNWHGQNPSQWLYAGCILVQDGRVSIHT